jgi:polysaccharide chain length determinant protein (PEP-CTERM system associated)
MREVEKDDLSYPPRSHEGIVGPARRPESTGMVEGHGSESQIILQVIEVALRRKYSILVPFLLATIVTLYLCVVMPPIYRSETTILVEPQQVPEHYIQSTVTGSVRDRLSTISQQILSRTRLESVIREFGLYAEGRDKYHMEEVVDAMRENIEIIVEAGKRRLPRGEASAAAFKLAFQGKDPGIVQKVTMALADLYIEENLRVRETLARGTREFLNRELTDIEDELKNREEAIREFRQRYMGELPEQLEANLRTQEQLQEQKKSVLDSLREAEDRLILLERQLDETPMYLSEMVSDGQDLHTQLALKRQRLDALSSRYTDLYPDVRTLKKEIQELEQRIARTLDREAVPGEKSSSAVDSNPPLNPAYSRLLTQVEADSLTIGNLREEVQGINARMRLFQRRIENIPKREQQLMSLRRDYETIKESYDSLMERKINAEIAENLEMRQKSERFRILDPANYPQKPVKPNRLKILVIGLMLGLGLGGGLALLRDQMDDTFHSADEVKAFFDIPVLGNIPALTTPEQISRKKIKRWTLAAISLGSFLTMLAGIHIYIKHIDLLVVDFLRMFL